MCELNCEYFLGVSCKFWKRIIVIVEFNKGYYVIEIFVGKDKVLFCDLCNIMLNILLYI